MNFFSVLHQTVPLHNSIGRWQGQVVQDTTSAFHSTGWSCQKLKWRVERGRFGRKLTNGICGLKTDQTSRLRSRHAATSWISHRHVNIWHHMNHMILIYRYHGFDMFWHPTAVENPIWVSAYNAQSSILSKNWNGSSSVGSGLMASFYIVEHGRSCESTLMAQRVAMKYSENWLSDSCISALSNFNRTAFKSIQITKRLNKMRQFWS